MHRQWMQAVNIEAVTTGQTSIDVKCVTWSDRQIYAVDFMYLITHDNLILRQSLRYHPKKNAFLYRNEFW